MLFPRHNYAKYRLSKLLGSADGRSKRTRPRQERLWRRRACRTREKIVHANLPLVPAMAKRSRATGVDLADLISEGQMAVLRCIEHFDISRGFKFSTYARRAILACLHRLAAKERRYCRHVPVRSSRRCSRATSASAGTPIRSPPPSPAREVILRNYADLNDVETPEAIKKGACVDVRVVVGRGPAHPNQYGHFLQAIEPYADETFPARADLAAVRTYPTLTFRVSPQHRARQPRAYAHCNLRGIWMGRKPIAVTD